jgi:hypothetical protein
MYRLDQRLFHRSAHKEHGSHARHDTCGRMQPEQGNRNISGIPAEHVEFAMSEIDDLQHAEDQRDTKRDQCVKNAGNQPVHCQLNDGGKSHSVLRPPECVSV